MQGRRGDAFHALAMQDRLTYQTHCLLYQQHVSDLVNDRAQQFWTERT